MQRCKYRSRGTFSESPRTPARTREDWRHEVHSKLRSAPRCDPAASLQGPAFCGPPWRPSSLPGRDCDFRDKDSARAKGVRTWSDRLQETPNQVGSHRADTYLARSLTVPQRRCYFGVCRDSPRSRERSAECFPPLGSRGLGATAAQLRGEPLHPQVCQEPRRPPRPARVSCVVVAVRVCLSVSPRPSSSWHATPRHSS